MPNSPNVAKNYSVTVVIPTYKRADILSYLLDALGRQSYRDFDVVVVVKPSGDGTEQLLAQAKGFKVTLVIQNKGHIVDAYFLGVKNSTGKIVAFLDDDAIPADNWLEETVKVFQNSNFVAVTGDSFPVLLQNGEMQVLREREVPSVLSPYEFALFGHPLKGLEEYKNCIAKSGLVYERGNNAYWRKRGMVKALLRGPSMAVLGDVLRSIDLPGEWILGCAWEMVLGWQLWKRGHQLVFSPNVKVYHVVHGRTSSRDFLLPRSDLLWGVEAELLFYRLYPYESQFSVKSKVASDVVRVVHTLRYLKSYPKLQTTKLVAMFFGSILGAKWLLYSKLRKQYPILSDLEKFRK
ncbi:MAG: glycosyltransferase [Candidatus Bathyarchaeota archaeon]|nr:glycosyltransferase [Candidatus Bathyarchaeota archaeon]